MTKQTEEIENKKLLKGILITLLDGKPREKKVEILKEAGFNQPEILDICGPSATTLRTRKFREGKKNG